MADELTGGLRIIWTALGPAVIDSSGKLGFPKLPTSPGLYRFSVLKLDGTRSEYIGETDNLQRRFAHYRNPGPTQATNLRLNALFRQSLSEGGQIDISVAVEKAWISWGRSEVNADFRSKYVRRLFENFVLAADGGVEIDSLNR